MFNVKKLYDMIDDQDKINLDLKEHHVREILKERLGYAWKACNIRPEHSIRADVVKNRQIFKEFMRNALKNGAQITYIDEMSVCTRHLSFRSWISKINPVKIIAPPASESISVIGAIS